MAKIIGDWNIHPDNRYVVEYSYRGGKASFQILNGKLSSFEGLVGRIENSPLGAMYKAMKEFQFSYHLPYNLLVRSVYTDKDDEILIRLGDTTCRFGKTEFALISGLSFKEVDSNSPSVEEVSHSSLIAIKDDETGFVDMSRAPFLGPLKDITISKLETELRKTDDPEIAYKLGLIYFVEVVLHGKQAQMAVSPLVFGLVEDTSRFLSYPWGRYFWDLSLDIWKRKINLMKIPLDPGKKSKKDEITSLMVVLFVWAYETLPSRIVEKLAVKTNDVTIPRMSRWHQCEKRIQEKTFRDLLEKEPLVVKRSLEPDEDEIRWVLENGLTDDDIKFPPPIYPPPRFAPPTMNNTKVATTHATPNASRGIDSNNIHIHNTINNVIDEMRGKVEIVKGYVRRYRQELMDKIDGLRNEFTASNEAMIRMVTANRVEAAEQNRVILAALHRIWSLINHQTRLGVNFVDRGDQQNHEVNKPASNHETDIHKGVDGSMSEVSGDEQQCEANENLSDEGDYISPSRSPPCESEIEKMNRVKYSESLKDRTVKFMKWYNAPKSPAITIRIIKEECSYEYDLMAPPYVFDPLMTNNGQIEDWLVEAYVVLLKRRMAAQPCAFRSKSVVLHHTFAGSMVERSLPHPSLYAHVWKKQTTAYTLWQAEPNHWIAIEMSVEKWTMYVYDLVDGYENKDTILKQLKVWAFYMRVLLQAAPFVCQLPDMLDPYEPGFAVQFIKDPELLQMKGRPDSAVYALKYIEDLTTVGHIRRVSEKDIMEFKKRFAADLYCEYFGNYGSC